MDIVARSETAYSEEFPIKPHEPVVMEISVGDGSGVYSAGDSRGTTEVTGCAALARIGDAGHDTIQTVVLEHGPVASELFSEEESGVAVSYTHLRAHETDSYLVCRLLLEKKK